MPMIRRHKQTYEPGQVVNERPRPRVLVVGYGDRWTSLTERLQRHIATVENTPSLGSVNLNEWDCLVINDEPVVLEEIYDEQGYAREFVGFKWRARYPGHLSVIYAHRLPSERGSEHDFTLVDIRPSAGEAPDLNDNPMIFAEWEKVGTHLRPVFGLPDRLGRLVQSDLIPAVEGRGDHLTFRDRTGSEGEYVGGAPIRAFLYGPDDSILAGSYERNDEAAVWLLPADVPSLHLWVVEALREWHEDYPDRFPLIPDWQQAPEWRTAQERALHAASDERRRILMEAFEVYQGEQAAFEAEAEEAAVAGDRYERALLSADGEPLSEAVAQALTDLGFRVVDMDQVYPEGDKREDLQVFDEEDPDWVVLAEVKGFKGGIRETGIHVSLSRWIRRYMRDHSREPNGLWYIANHNRLIEPNSRPAQFRGKNDVLKTFADDDGLVIDTRALFDLVVAVQEDPARARSARQALKSGTGFISRVDPRDLDTASVPRDED